MVNRLLTVSVGLLVAGCGGGGSGGNLGLNDGNQSGGVNTDVLLNYNGCTQEYFQTIMGTYKGSAEVHRGSAAAPQMCRWDATVTITGRSIGPQCLLRADTRAPVEQGTVYTDEDDRYLCIEDKGTRLVSEPLSGTYSPDVFPDLDNSNFPVELEFVSNNNLDAGPTGDGPADYLNLFDGLQSTAVERVVAAGDGTLSLQVSRGGEIGRLVKEAQ